MNIMTLDEMKKHEWVVSWSGGKDSTATIILMHQHNIPIKEIRHVEMMFDDSTPANAPMMTDFIYDTKKVFESWGYYVRIVKSIRTMCDEAYRIFQRPKRDYLKGTYYGISAVMARRCQMAGVKVKTIESIKNENDYHMVGIACDEPKRLERLRDKKYSILQTLNVTEADCVNICKEHNLYAPIYDYGLKRDGCFFCPNASKAQRVFYKTFYPELVRKIYSIIELNPLCIDFVPNIWIDEYLKYDLFFETEERENNSHKGE